MTAGIQGLHGGMDPSDRIQWFEKKELYISNISVGDLEMGYLGGFCPPSIKHLLSSEASSPFLPDGSFPVA